MGRSASRGIRLPDDPENDPDASGREKFLWHRQGEHEERDRADRGRREHVAGECTPLGICDIELPPFLPKGSPVELTYNYNENQVLEVAVDACGN